MSHFNAEISDFVVGLLSKEEQQRISDHIADCSSCRHQVEIERKMVSDIRSTIQAATNYKSNRLKMLQAHPSSSYPVSWKLVFTKQFALGVTLMFIVLGGMVIDLAFKNGLIANDRSDAATMTAAVTETPSNTATATSDLGASEISQDSAFTSGLIKAIAAPIPAMTPVSEQIARGD